MTGRCAQQTSRSRRPLSNGGNEDFWLAQCDGRLVWCRCNHDPPKLQRGYGFTRLHGVTYRKAAVCMVTAVRTTNLTQRSLRDRTSKTPFRIWASPGFRPRNVCRLMCFNSFVRLSCASPVPQPVPCPSQASVHRSSKHLRLYNLSYCAEFIISQSVLRRVHNLFQSEFSI
jgi:hypothetical protein